MSLKLNQFAQIITQPLNVHKFIVDIPGVTTASIVVASTTFPSEKLQTIKLWYQGEYIEYPTTPTHSHRWKVRVPETDSGEIRRQMDSLKSRAWNQKLGLLSPQRWPTVKVTARDLKENLVFATELHGTYLLGREDVELNNSDPTQNWNWDYEFCFQWLQDIDYENAGSAAQISAK